MRCGVPGAARPSGCRRGKAHRWGWGASVIAADLAGLATPVDDLRTLDGNPRRGDVPAVARSLMAFGQRKPIVARRDGTVIAGNHTLVAARSLGWDRIAVVWVDDDDTTAKAFALADNRSAELGGYDDADLRAMLEALAGDAELLAATSWDASHLEDLAARLAVPALGDLAEKYGDYDDEELWPLVHLKVSPETHDAWNAVVLADGGDPVATFSRLVADKVDQ